MSPLAITRSPGWRGAGAIGSGGHNGAEGMGISALRHPVVQQQADLLFRHAELDLGQDIVKGLAGNLACLFNQGHFLLVLHLAELLPACCQGARASHRPGPPAACRCHDGDKVILIQDLGDVGPLIRLAASWAWLTVFEIDGRQIPAPAAGPAPHSGSQSQWRGRPGTIPAGLPRCSRSGKTCWTGGG